MTRTTKKLFLYTNQSCKKAKNSLLQTKTKIKTQKIMNKTQILMTKIFLLSKFKTNQKIKQKLRHKESISMFKTLFKRIK